MTQQKIRSILRPLLRITVAALAIIIVPWLIGAAAAATGDAPTAPPPTPDAIAAYVQTYGWIVGIVALAYVVAKYLLKVNDSKHWIAQGRTLAAIAGLVAVVGAGLQAYTSGTPWSGVIATAVLGLLHLADAQVAPTRNPQSGFARLSVMAVLAAVGTGGVVLVLTGVAAIPTAGCTQAERATLATNAKSAFINCTAQQVGTTPALDIATLVAIANTVAAERVKCTPAGGALNWQCIEQDAIGDGETLGGCAFLKLVAAAATSTASATSGLVAGATTTPPGRVEFEGFRAKVAPGAKFHTAAGDY